MPRTGARKYLNEAAGTDHSYFVKESTEDAATVDLLDSEFETAFGHAPTTITQLMADYRVVRTDVATAANEAADTIGIGRITRNVGDDGWTVTFTTDPADTKYVGVMVVKL